MDADGGIQKVRIEPATRSAVATCLVNKFIYKYNNYGQQINDGNGHAYFNCIHCCATSGSVSLIHQEIHFRTPEAHCGVNITQVNRKVQDVGGLQHKEWVEMGKYVCHCGGSTVA